ncbi:MAG: fatty acid desaturase, partial [Deltaproteobacteria bacterium]|nr:fatty acid desaturase [Deltaproteobacteria bacterium]
MATQKLNNFCKKICWTNLLFILLTPVVAVIGITWLYSRGGSHWGAWVLLPVMMGLTGLGITAGYHRLFSHRSYQAHWLVRLFYLLFGGACFEGSVREWCQAHRRHHQYTDKEGDPYNAKKGFLYSHILWIFLKSDQSDLSNIQDLLADQLVRWQDRYYVVLAVLFGFGLPTGVAALWGDPWGGLFIAGVLRVVLNHHLTWLINSYCHFVGRQTYSDQVTARDSGFISLFTYGEGFHNFHHAFQADYRNGVRAFHWDPSKWLIFLLSKMGLTKNLRRIPAPAILAARLRMDEKRLREFMLQRER